MSEPIDIETLNAELQADNIGWSAAANPITQLSSEEQNLLLGVNPGPNDMTVEEAHQATLATPTVTVDQAMAEMNAGAPPRFDNRNVGGRNYTTPVKNQGSCGSCVAFGTVGVLETTYQRQHNLPDSGIDLSEAHMFYCHGSSVGASCANGWLPEPAFTLAKDQGVATEDMFPYVGSQQTCQVQNGWQNSKITSAGHQKLTSRAAIKDWIATKGSVTGCFVVYSDFFAYRSGVYRRQSDERRGGHCVEIIGYDDAEAAWICKNSWGTGWGDNGYVKIGYGQCQIETWAGPYGVTGVTLKAWANGAKVTGLYTTKSAKNTWAHLSGQGWKRLATSTEQTQHAMLAELIAARTADRKVNALLDGNKINTLYALV